MNPERHARIKELFLLACRRPVTERARFLQEACGEDADVRAGVEKLLAHHSEARPAVAEGATATVASTPPVLATSSGDGGARDGGCRWETGAMVAGRYRIVDLLGEGGMGEVYRAEDLQLGQTVALKFLPPRFAHDETWLDRFRQEVRLAREVTHLNVCRVYDLGEANGEHFISMEYVDGENLKTLLSRIGRLPRDKALEIARQLCVGLAAAHAKGVLHRDLKPANVMLDGRGQVRITDFGLAATREEIRGTAVLAGTPAYMAPEQLSGKDVSVRSDLYALGLVLYELFTGQPAFRAESFAEYARIKEGSRPTPPSRLIEEIEPAVERVILACLERRPEDRPANALEVAAALPGSDLLGAALAAGETPSPDMVAAAGASGAVGSRWAGVGLAAFVVLTVVVSLLTPLSHPLCQPPAVKSPQVLAERAREILQEAQLAPPRDEASGFLDGEKRFLTPFSLIFWYRAGAGPLAPAETVSVLFGGARVTPADPPLTEPGMVKIVLDGTGQLLELVVVPSPIATGAPAAAPVDRSPSAAPVDRAAPTASVDWAASARPVDWAAPATPVDWTALILRTGLDIRALTPCPPETMPPVAADARRAWCGAPSTDTGHAVRVEAAERAGRPVYLAVLDDTRSAERTSDASALARRRAILDYGWKGLVALCVLVSLPLARRNLQCGRSDLRGAWRLAVCVYAIRMASWILQAQHVAEFNGELLLLVFALVGGLAEAALLWLFYIALEPYARRYWPQLLVAWTRLLRGQLRDPVVGGQIVMGTVLGACWAMIQALERPLAAWLGLATRSALRADSFYTGLLNTRYALAGDLDILRNAIYNGLSFLLLLVVLRMCLRRPTLAAVVGTLLITPLIVPRGSNVLLSWILLGGGVAGLLAWFMVRFGLLTVVTGLCVGLVLTRAPLTIHLGVWYSDLSLTAAVLTWAIALYGYLAARSGGDRPRRAVV